MRKHWGFVLDRMDGFTGVVRPAVSFDSVDEAIRVMQEFRACFTAGPDGGICIWVRDDGKYGAEFNKLRRVINETTFDNTADLLDWLGEYFPECGEVT